MNFKNNTIISGKKAICSIVESKELKSLIKTVYLSSSQKYLIDVCKQNNVPFEVKEKSFFDKNFGNKKKYKYKFANALIDSKPTITVEKLIKKTSQGGTIVILDHLQDPFNLGSILRTCAAADIDGVIIPKNNQAPLNHDATIKSSQGYSLTLDIAIVSNLHQTVLSLKKAGYWIYGADMSEGAKDFRKIKYDDKSAIIMGSEGDGISNILKNDCDHRVYIPMKKGIDSLNVSVATGIIIFNIKNKFN